MSKFILVASLALCAFAGLASAEDVIDCKTYNKDPDSCLGTDECSYCITSTYSGDRCGTVRGMVKQGCPRAGIINFIESAVVVTPPTGDDKPSPPIPFPMLPGTKRRLTITFELANHPVDVYYLMDFSGSMYDDKENVIALSEKLVDAVHSMSPDNTLGFGSFVDKPHNPFGSPGDYSYKNDLPLAASTTKATFADLIKALPILSGSDGPESQADAMFQTVSCVSEVGWRKHARHLLVLATDIGYHRAGDGLANGIPTPFDGKCHLNSDGLYTEEVNLDYPSEEQLIQAFDEHQVTPIFAVTPDSLSEYLDLSSKLKTSGLAALDADSSNVVDLIMAEYKKIESRFELETTPVTDELTVKFYTSCDGTDVKETTLCDALETGGKVTFEMEVELEKCPDDPKDWSQLLSINPVGLPTGLDVGLALICN